MKIRIFALAKELGLDSKELIEHANAAGVEVKNSALASISPEERDLVLAQIQQAQRGGTSVAVKTEAAPAVRRESGADRAAKIRAIDAPVRSERPTSSQAVTPSPDDAIEEPVAEKAISKPAARETVPEAAPVSQPAAPSKRDAKRSETAASVKTDAPVVPTAAETAAEKKAKLEAEQRQAREAAAKSQKPIRKIERLQRADSRPARAEPAERPPAVEVTEEPSVPESPAAETPAAAEMPAAAQEDGGAEKGSPRPGVGKSEERGPVPMGSRRGMRDMRPVGTVQSTMQAGEKRDREKDKEKKRPPLARPMVAEAPKFTPARPKVEPTEGPAQKPDVPLTPGMMKDRSSPLSAHLASRGSEKKGPGKRPGGGGGRDLSAEEREQEILKARRKGGRSGKRGRPEDGDDDSGGRRTLHRMRSRRGPIAYTSAATVETPITVRSLSEAMGRPAKQLLAVLFKQGQMVSINDPIEEELAMEIAIELGVDLSFKRGRSLEDELEMLFEPDTDPELLEARPVVVTVLGHVDHGKTTLVDKIRSANIAAGEAGGITQHIAAYQVDRNGQKVTFVDTPGHAAFGEMRARGANVTDIVVLVVAANDGVMPQTEECISHARAAGVPMIVALNKSDLPGIDENKALQSLAARNVLPAEWGGDTEVVRTSGLTGKGIDELLDTILISAELRELKANSDRPAIGVCLEAFRDEGRGPIAWGIVQNGTLSVGEILLCGSAYGRVRAMYDDQDREIEEAGPSTPVKIAGLESIPEAGAHFVVLEDIDDARTLAEERQRAGRAEFLASQVHRPHTLEDILAAAKGGEVQDLPMIIKADTPGSIEAIRHELAKLDHPEVRVRLIHTGVGGVNESDVSLASASGAVIVAFHVVAEDRAASLADREGVQIRRYNIIYEVVDTIRDQLEGMLKPELREVATGRAIVLQTFKISRTGTIAGCRVLNGTIERNNRMHLIRQQTLMNTFGIAGLRREKDDVREVREGMECGIRLDNFNDLKEGDLLESFRIEEVKRKFD